VKINWKRVWRRQSAWYQSQDGYPDWASQRRMIKFHIDAELKPKPKPRRKRAPDAAR
jgi:hypothetical protein